MNIKLLNFEIKGDNRGSLIAIESLQNIPFEIKRVYYIFATKEGVTRGMHAHKELQQVAICVSGSCRFKLDDGKSQSEILLDSPEKGLFIDKMVWREMSDFSSDCVLIVIANHFYNENDYIKDYKVFLKVVNDSPDKRS